MNNPSDTGEGHPSSFRDPSGFVFSRNKTLYRQINKVYSSQYDYLIASGLYAKLAEQGSLINHEEVDVSPAIPEVAYKVIRPELVAFVSYPCEWAFDQLKDAALLTLMMQRSALNHNMSLKDASAHNIQFHRGRAVFIDTLSFEILDENRPWVAYRQFCEHFLAPLALMAKVDVRLGLIQSEFINGIPLDLTCSLLPARTRFRPQLLIHLHLHAKSQRRFEGKPTSQRQIHMGKNALLGLVDSLESAVKGLFLKNQHPAWSDYCSTCTYTEQNFEEKKEFVSSAIAAVNPARLWDVGCNTGSFSFMSAQRGIQTLALDSDHDSINRLYTECRSRSEKHILPLVLDITNPTAGMGWAGEERSAFLHRGQADLVLGLALIHHLAISANVPLARIARLLASIGPALVVEFVPKDDPQTLRLLASRQDIFADYDQAHFESDFGRYFKVERKRELSESKRTMYLMRRIA